jgi:hypothetical protein
MLFRNAWSLVLAILWMVVLISLISRCSGS